MHPRRLFTRLTRLRLKLVRGVSLASLWQVLLARPDSRRSADRASCCCNQRGPSTSDKSSVLGSVANRNHPLGGFLFALRGQAFLRLSAPTLDASSFGSLPGLCRAGAGNLLSVFCSRAIVDSLALRHPFHTLGTPTVTMLLPRPTREPGTIDWQLVLDFAQVGVVALTAYLYFFYVSSRWEAEGQQ